jgi:hypothetical protein
MDPIFPGMDPYLEAPEIWPNVHNSLAIAIRNQLQPLLNPRYVATIEEYGALETISITPPRRLVPDVSVADRGFPGSGRVSVTIAAAPLSSVAPIEVETRYLRIHIRATGDRALVTAIEILSPVNKRPGADAADAYERKRQEIFHSATHLLEIDLLRGGRRPTVADPLPEVPYFVFLSRAEGRPAIDIWPLPLRERFPIVPVPLQWPDPDVPLDLNAALAHAYRDARYDLLVDYRQPPPPPELSAEDAAWVDELLRSRGLRGE